MGSRGPSKFLIPNSHKSTLTAASWRQSASLFPPPPLPRAAVSLFPHSPRPISTERNKYTREATGRIPRCQTASGRRIPRRPAKATTTQVISAEQSPLPGLPPVSRVLRLFSPISRVASRPPLPHQSNTSIHPLTRLFFFSAQDRSSPHLKWGMRGSRPWRLMGSSGKKSPPLCPTASTPTTSEFTTVKCRSDIFHPRS